LATARVTSADHFPQMLTATHARLGDIVALRHD
jgi:hypothetical protein